jgi:formylglycine-generating enzyme required for sulfatase activity
MKFWTRRVLEGLLVVTLAGLGFAVWRNSGSVQDSAAHERTACKGADEPVSTPHPGMVWVPSGSFNFGDTVYPEEKPVRATKVQGFWMDRTEVTNAQFDAFVRATGYITNAEKPVDASAHPGLPADMQRPGAVVFISPIELRNGGDPRQWWQYVPGANWRHPGGAATSIEGKGALPVVNVTIDDARAYSAWMGHVLPSEAQWEWAALGGQVQTSSNVQQPVDANTWQGLFPVSNQTTDGFAGAAPVGCFKPNGYGLFDMIGNVWELTADRFTEGHSPEDNMPPDQPPVAVHPGALSGRHVIKGGSYLCAPNYCMRYRPGARQAQEDDLATSHLGFRTILLAPGP